MDGAPVTLRLTLGALAELEQELQTPSLVALVERFETGAPSARDVLAVIAAGLRGADQGTEEGAWRNLATAEIAFEGRAGPIAAYALAGRLLAAAFAEPSG